MQTNPTRERGARQRGPRSSVRLETFFRGGTLILLAVLALATVAPLLTGANAQ